MLATLRFEHLDAGHIPAILEIEKEANGAPWSEKSFQNELSHPHGFFLVGLEMGVPIAYGGIWMVIDEAHIITLAVHSEHRRKGIGEKLMTRLLNEAVKRGAQCASLEVRASNEPAMRLYEKFGFVRAAVRKAYYPDNKEDAVIMWLYELPAAASNWSRA
jgi:ribosomal-protein-alanine N-acetyltransferase